MCMTDLEYQVWYCETYKATYPILKRAGKRLLAHFCYALAPDLEDMMSDAYIAMYKKRKKLIVHPNINGWLIVALKYIILKRMRKWARNRDALIKLKNEVEIQNQARKADLDFENAEDVYILIQTLGSENYELLRAYHVDGVSIEELARRCGKSVGATYMKISRLRRRGYDILNSTDFKSIVVLWLAMNFMDRWFK